MKKKATFHIPVWRRALILGLLACGVAIMMSRAVYLQVFNKDFLQRQGDARILRDLSVPANRGMITDRHGEPLAISAPVSSVWVNPQEFAADQAQIKKLAKLTGTKHTRLRSLLAQRSDREFVYLRRHMSPQEANQILALEIPGVHVRKEYRRYYPGGEVTAHLVGFTDIDGKGREGMELAHDQWLQARPGRERVIRDRLGRTVETLSMLSEAASGNDLRLSIDRRIQYLAYRELKAAVLAHGARSGSAVVLDIRSGEVLAMVNQPSYNPNNRSESEIAAYRNRVVTDLYEPGSTIKPFIVAAALAGGRYTPGTRIDTGPGLFKVGGATIRDTRDHGVIDVRTVLQKSSNIGASKIALNIKPRRLWTLLSEFGFGEAVGSGFPGETAGTMKHYVEWRDVDRATLAYGYGVSTSTLHLAQAYGALLGDGYLKPVSYVRLGKQQIEERPGRKVLDMTVVKKMRSMLTSVISDDGTGAAAAVDAYVVAGKTGTARKARPGGYMEDSYLSIFAGAIPASDPRLVMVVMVDDPRSEKYYGGVVAAPVFSNVMADAVRMLNISPDGERRERTRVALMGNTR